MSDKLGYKAVIIDDSSQARKLLKLMLLELAPEVTLVGEAENVDEGLKLIENEQPDAVFLDIEMPGKTGIQLAEILLERNFKGNVVFTTAYNAYAIKAFRLSAIDYLLKPIQEDQLTEAVKKLKEEKKNRDNQSRLNALSENLREERNEMLCIPSQSGFEYLPVSEIEYLEADGSYVKIYCINNRSLTVSKNLKYFENALADCTNFIRPHRSFLVNIDYVTNYSKSDGGFLVLKRNVQIPVSRERKQAIQEILK
ncbi:MAG: LytTR family DNA-binding domain-containing protein [Cryomorphaceae bacterium]|nr:LytTR family DNA-binding domain-containing protein [Cryomorphaceae bacterium]